MKKVENFTLNYPCPYTACSFGKIYVLGGKWLSFVLRVELKVVNKAYSIYSLFESVSKVIG